MRVVRPVLLQHIPQAQGDGDRQNRMLELVVGTLRVAHDQVEIVNRVEVAGSLNPTVASLPVRLITRSGAVGARTGVGKDCAADNLDAERVPTRDDLVIGGDVATQETIMLSLRDFAIARQHAEVLSPSRTMR